MRENFIDAASPEGMEYRALIEQVVQGEPNNQAAKDFLKAFDEKRGCDPLDFLDYFPHGGVGVHGPGC